MRKATLVRLKNKTAPEEPARFCLVIGLFTEAQKLYFRATCTLRAPWEDRIYPRLEPREWPGAFRIGVFKTLVASPRTSRFWCSVITKCFTRLKSRLARPGPRIVPTPQLPKVPVWAPYALGSNQR